MRYSIYAKVVLMLAAIGAIDSFYLLQKHYSSDPFVCPIFGGCETVINSQYSEVFGVPVALFGLIYYLFLLVMAVLAYLFEKFILLDYVAKLTFLGFFASSVLVFIMLFIIKAVCFYCLVSAIVSTTLFLVSVKFLNDKIAKNTV